MHEYPSVSHRFGNMPLALTIYKAVVFRTWKDAGTFQVEVCQLIARQMSTGAIEPQSAHSAGISASLPGFFPRLAALDR